MYIDELKAFNTDRGSVEEMIWLLAQGDLLVAKYQDFSEYGLEVPDWVTSKLKQIRRELRNKQMDYLERSLAEARLKMEGKKSEAQQKAALAAKIRRDQELLERMGA